MTDYPCITFTQNPPLRRTHFRTLTPRPFLRLNVGPATLLSAKTLLQFSLSEDGALDLLPSALFVLLASALGAHLILPRADLAH